MTISKYPALLCLLFTFGCSAVPLSPRVTLTSPASGTPPVHVEGPHGPLSVQQTKAILGSLEQSAPETSIFTKHLKLEEEIAGSPLMSGNKVTLLIDGPATYKSMYAAIQSATDHINLETYDIEADEVGRKFMGALIAKQRSGVQVNLIYDSIGSHTTPKDFFKQLSDSGAHVLEFNPITPLTLLKAWKVGRDHRKLLVVDGQVAFVGGVNISSVYSSGSFKSKPHSKKTQPWRDTHIRIEGPVVSEFQKFFLTTWVTQNGGALGPESFFPKLRSKGNDVVRAIGTNAVDHYSPIYITLISAINSAETYAYITNAYFVPDAELLKALKNAAQRNVDVRLLLPAKTDWSVVFYASRSYYDELLSAGVKIYEREDALLHAKTAIIDGVWSTVGSTNLDWLSIEHNQEINAVILGQEFGVQMKSMFEKDMGASELITLEEWRKRSVGLRLKEFGARLLSGWI